LKGGGKNENVDSKGQKVCEGEENSPLLKKAQVVIQVKNA